MQRASQEASLTRGDHALCDVLRRYVIIAHGRVFAKDGMVKYDIAKAKRVTVTSDVAGETRGYHLGEWDIPVCWRTQKDALHPLYNVPTQLNECPVGLGMSFIAAPPTRMMADASYDISYNMTIGGPANPNVIGVGASAVVVSGDVEVPHANLHSCFSKISFCTPFIANDGSLSTHTSAQSVESIGNGSAIFEQTLTLSKAEQYVSDLAQQ